MKRHGTLNRISILAAFVSAIPVWADTYQRQRGIDVVHYEIALELNDEDDTVRGQTRVHVQMRQDVVEAMWLDFVGMTVDGLSVAGRPATFRHGEGRIVLDLDRPYKGNEIAVIEIDYHGVPQNRGLLIGNNAYGRRVFFAENWPDRARYWFPSIDHPSDKSTVDYRITAPAKYTVVANGRLVETRSLLDGRTLTRWSEGVPIPTYCMVFGVAEFSVSSSGQVDGIPLLTYAYPQDAAAAAAKFARSNLAMEYFIDLIGPYPYEKLAQVQSTTRIGGMENSSVIFYTERSFQGPSVREGPVPHEIAHQWFGDSITEADWDHLWLSEGFATYFSALFYEHLEGPESMKATMTQAAEAVKSYHRSRPVALIDPEMTDLMGKLNAFNYQKGAWVLHMLRGVLGDELFFDGIRRFYRVYEGRNAMSDDFQRVLEATAGRSLQTFFQQWLYQPGWPEYDISWHWNSADHTVEVLVAQTQETGLFDMPLAVVLVAGDRREASTVQVSGQAEVFRIPFDREPASVEVDPDGWVLKTIRMAGPR